MKPIGLIGGLTYVSTLEYYRYLNVLVNERLGGAEAASIIMYSINFGEIKTLTEADDWEKISILMCDAATKIENAGAACLLLGANTMHKIADEVQSSVKIPIIHVAEAVAKDISRVGLKKVGLLGTRFTMQEAFYCDRLTNNAIETIIPDDDEVEFINYTIYNEFSKNIFSAKTKAAYLNIISRLKQKGAEGIIMGCTEIPSLINQSDCDIPLFDTVKIHSAAAVDHVFKL